MIAQRVSDEYFSNISVYLISRCLQLTGRYSSYNLKFVLKPVQLFNINFVCFLFNIIFLVIRCGQLNVSAITHNMYKNGAMGATVRHRSVEMTGFAASGFSRLKNMCQSL